MPIDQAFISLALFKKVGSRMLDILQVIFQIIRWSGTSLPVLYIVYILDEDFSLEYEVVNTST